MKYLKLTIPVILALFLLAIILSFPVFPVLAQTIAFPRIFRENPGSCLYPGYDPMETQTIYEFSDSMGPFSDDIWAYVGDPGGTPQLDEIYICPPVGYTWETFDLEVAMDVRQYSYGSYRNEHEFRIKKGYSEIEWWDNVYGGGDGFTTEGDDTEQLPFEHDLDYDTPYRIEWVVRAATRTAPTPYAYAEQQLYVSFVGWVVEDETDYNYCQDGIELISPTVYLGTLEKWTGNVTTEWDRFYVKYVFRDPLDNGALVGMGMWAGDELLSRRFYSDPSNETDTYTYTVPNRTDPEGQTPGGELDYNKYGFAPGPVADLMFDNYYGPVNLLSACVLEAHRPLTPSTWCTDGLELLEAPVSISAYGGEWETTVYGVEYQHITVKYVVENPMYPYSGLTDQMQAMPGVEYTLYWVEANLEGQQYITFTLPATGVIKMRDEQLFLEWFNYGVAVNLASICMIDAQDSMPQLTAEQCHLLNPDFVYELTGWSTYGSVLWDYYEENGLIEAESGGMAFQNAIQNRGTVWNMEVRAKRLTGEGDTLDMGSNTTSLIYGGPQINTYDLGQYYAVYDQDIFVEDGGYIQVSGNDAVIDYVCLVEPDDFLLTPSCTEPQWDPIGSGDSLLVYLIKFLADIQQYVGCIILRAIALAVNAVTGFLRDILLRIPALPNPGSGVYSWFEWITEWFARYLDWIGINLSNFAEWIPTNMNELAGFLHSMYMEFIFWLSEQLEVDPFWLLETLDDIWDEALLFWDEIQDELDQESEDLFLLLENMANVMLVLVNGVREGVSGETIAYIGTDFEGVGAFIWTGVDFLNTAIENTPLVALNLVALAAITLSLGQWTVTKFLETLEAVG